MSAFDPAKDVIDLSRIDGDITAPGVQNFTFIGSAPFSGGAQVRYQLNPANDTTIVQAALAGDTTADFSITLAGPSCRTTAANFALTSSQSTAALANGAALTYTQVTTAAGAPTEYAYSNVQGRAYTSYESFYGSGYENIEADDRTPVRTQHRPLRPQSDSHEGRRQRIPAGGDGQRSVDLPSRRDHRRKHQHRRAVRL